MTITNGLSGAGQIDSHLARLPEQADGIPTQITYRHTAPSDALNALIHQEVARLEEFKERPVECRVVVDQPNQHHREKHFRVEVSLLVPGAQLVASADPTAELGEDAYAAVHVAFKDLRRQLVEHAERKRQQS